MDSIYRSQGNANEWQASLQKALVKLGKVGARPIHTEDVAAMLYAGFVIAACSHGGQSRVRLHPIVGHWVRNPHQSGYFCHSAARRFRLITFLGTLRPN